MNIAKTNTDSVDLEVKFTKDITKKRGILNKFDSIYWLVMFMVFLLPIFFLPINILGLGAAKTSLFVFISCIIFFVFIIQAIKQDSFKLPFNLISLSVTILGLSYILSSIFSGHFGLTFFGRDFGYDTTLMTLLFLGLMMVISAKFRDPAKSFNLYLAAIFSFLLVAVLQIINIFLPSTLNFLQFFTSPTANVVGKFNDLAIFSGLALIVSLLTLEFFKLNKKLKIVLTVVASISILIMLLVGFMDLWILITIFSIIMFSYVLSKGRNNKKTEDRKFPVLSLAAFLIGFIAFFGSGNIAMIQDRLNLINIEGRINLVGTYQIAKDSLSDNLFFGQGPARFDIAWNQYKQPVENNSDFWNTNFRHGFGYIVSTPVTVGLVGSLAWLFFLGIYFFIGIKNIFNKKEDEGLSFINFSSFIISAYLWIVSIFYVPGIAIFVLNFVFTGIFLASLYQGKSLKFIKINLKDNHKLSFVYVFTLVVLLLAVIFSGYIYIEKLVANHFYQKTIISLNENNLDQAILNNIKTIQTYPNDLYYRSYSEILTAKLFEVLNNESLSEEDRATSFASVFRESILASNSAVMYDEDNYLNYLSSGNVYASVNGINLEDLNQYEVAKQRYEEALNFSPTNPSIYLALARNEISNENLDAAKEYITQALQLKRDYLDAIYLFAQIQISEGELEEAINSVAFAVSQRPNNPETHFQLGLLRYENREYEMAKNNFERAVILNPTYLNAKYFLGLSYERLDRTADAIIQFENLETFYPEDQGIKDTLNKLRNNENIFTGDNAVQEVVNSESGEIEEELPVEESVE